VLDGSYRLVADVRFAGRADLVADLRKHGPPPEENATDEELLLQAWRLWGEACLQRIIGDFSFALHDAPSKMLWCVRDFVGTRQFFYSHLGEVFAFRNVSFLAYGDAAMRGYVDRRHGFGHPELDWQRAKRYAAEVGAPRMLYLALQLSESA
jgi:asparagine synthase (glutamine-hydrolysing)